tara:strand:- start:1940 stop:2389 length:450 start_codon:yes stop_codon:yes gene_type:complete
MQSKHIMALALKQYSLAVTKILLLRHQRKKNTEKHESKLAAWLGSTELRNVFGSLMSEAEIVGQPYSVSYICEQLICGRQSAENMISECLAEGWIIQVKQTYNGYYAGPEMSARQRQFAETHLKWAFENGAVTAQRLYLAAQDMYGRHV